MFLESEIETYHVPTETRKPLPVVSKYTTDDLKREGVLQVTAVWHAIYDSRENA